MAISGITTWEVRTTGNDANGGGFDVTFGGTDYSQQDAAQATGTVTSSGATVTATSGIFTAAMVGNLITDGTTWKQITGFTSATVITVDSSPAWTAAAVKIGGALMSAGKAGALRTSGNKIWIKSGTYLITSASANVAGGCFSASTSAFIEGYSATRGDLGTPPVLQASGISTATIVQFSGGREHVRNLTVDGAGLPSIQGFNLNAGGNAASYYLLTAKNCTNQGIVSNRGVCIRCVATGCSGVAPAISAACLLCEAYGNTVTGIGTNSVGSSTTLWGCLSYANTGGSTDGFSVGAYGSAVNCTAYGNGRSGFSFDGSEVNCLNCLAEANGGYGFSLGSDSTLLSCGAYNNTSGAIIGTPILNTGFVTGTGTFFANAAGNNFALNNTSGAGSAARAAGVPGVSPRGTTTGFLDMGFAQHQDAGAGMPNLCKIIQNIGTY